MESADALVVALNSVVAPLGVEVDSVEIVKAGRHRSLEVLLDSDTGVDMDTVAAATRLVSTWLDDSDAMGEQPYLLEVSSRGVGRPLVTPAHWRRNVGRLVAVTVDGVGTTARLVAFDDPMATLEDARGARTLDIGTVSRAVVEVEFNRKEDD